MTRTFTTIGAVGVILAAQASVAETGSKQTQAESQAQNASNQVEFSQIDQNNDQSVEWSELQQEYSEQLSQNNWSQQQVMSSFDQNQDDALDQQEYAIFVLALEEQQQQRNQTAGVTQSGQQAGQQEGQEQGIWNESEDEMASSGAGAAAGQDQQYGQGEQATQQEDRMAATQEEDPSIYAQDEQSQEASQSELQQAQMVSLANGEQMALDQVRDSEIMNEQGESLGKVQDVVQSQTGDQTALVVSVGGFLGLGGKEVLINTDELSAQDDQLVFQAGANESQLKNRPEYNQQDYVSVR